MISDMSPEDKWTDNRIVMMKMEDREELLNILLTAEEEGDTLSLNRKMKKKKGDTLHL